MDLDKDLLMGTNLKTYVCTGMKYLVTCRMWGQIVNKKIAILCRGKSLQYLHKLPEFDEYIIVNKFDEELKRSDIIDKLGDKPITHVVGYSPTLTGNMISNNCYKNQ